MPVHVGQLANTVTWDDKSGVRVLVQGLGVGARSRRGPLVVEQMSVPTSDEAAPQ